MKQLNSNFTTPEQSRQLLDLGLPADSADIGRVDDIMHGGIEILTIPYTQWCKGYENISTPCWSVGRLIEIWQLCIGSDYIIYNDDNLTETLIDNIAGAIANNYMDFSILED